ncbi:hypothetical protein ACQR5U_02735 [Xanthomonas oryzae pv. oryzicola]|uniref:hypothetical protein n=1 Tax=Xanthomonas oryzae TaxID=347 RepID=UPI00117E05D3|nr:hypothetical protein [Xanthomonas oryzae]
MKGSFAACALLASFCPAAKECRDAGSCRIYINQGGGLMVSGMGKPVASNLESSDSPSVYINRRGDDYYLVSEGAGNDKSMVIVPLRTDGKDVEYKRVIFFSIQMLASTKQGHEVWGGQEYDFSNYQSIRDFSWDAIWKLRKSVPLDANVMNKENPDGFSVMTATVRSQDSGASRSRQYIYSKKFGLTPDDVACYENCPSSEGGVVVKYYGGIGKYPIRMELDHSAGEISGFYSYTGKVGGLYLAGSLDGNSSLVLKEYSDKNKRNQTGGVTAARFGEGFKGTWKNSSNSKVLPFFVVPDLI